MVLALASVAAGPVGLAGQDARSDERAIRAVVKSAYVEGIHGNGSREVIRAGFHPDFVMKVLGPDGTVTDVGIEEWIRRLPPEGETPPRPTRGEVSRVMLSGDAAVAEVAIFREGSQVFTDYISLYRFPEGWRMVAKIFHAHPSG